MEALDLVSRAGCPQLRWTDTWQRPYGRGRLSSNASARHHFYSGLIGRKLAESGQWIDSCPSKTAGTRKEGSARWQGRVGPGQAAPQPIEISARQGGGGEWSKKPRSNDESEEDERSRYGREQPGLDSRRQEVRAGRGERLGRYADRRDGPMARENPSENRYSSRRAGRDRPEDEGMDRGPREGYRRGSGPARERTRPWGEAEPESPRRDTSWQSRAAPATRRVGDQQAQGSGLDRELDDEDGSASPVGLQKSRGELYLEQAQQMQEGRRGRGSRAEGSGPRTEGLGSRTEGSGPRTDGSGFSTEGSWSRTEGSGPRRDRDLPPPQGPRPGTGLSGSQALGLERGKRVEGIRGTSGVEGREKVKVKVLKRTDPACYGCGAFLQTEDDVAPGYIAPDLYEMKKKHRQLRTLLCLRCRQLAQGAMVPAVSGNGGYGEGRGFISAEELREQLTFLRHEKALVVKLVDVVDFQGSFLNRVRDLVGSNPIILVVTKVDLLPLGTDMAAVGDWLLETIARKKLNVVSVHLTSSKAPLGISGVAATILGERLGRDVYVMGAANVGKSAFIAALLDEMSSRDPIAAAAKRRKPIASAMPGTTLGPIPIRAFSGAADLYDTAGVHLHHRMAAVVEPPDLPLLAPRRRLRGYVASLPRPSGTASSADTWHTADVSSSAESDDDGQEGSASGRGDVEAGEEDRWHLHGDHTGDSWGEVSEGEGAGRGGHQGSHGNAGEPGGTAVKGKEQNEQVSAGAGRLATDVDADVAPAHAELAHAGADAEDGGWTSALLAGEEVDTAVRWVIEGEGEEDELEERDEREEIDDLPGQQGMQGCTMFWGGLIRIDVLEAPPSTTFTFYGATGVRVRSVATREADDYYKRELGKALVPPSVSGGAESWEGLPSKHTFTLEPRAGLRPTADIAVSGLGWITVSGISKRDVRSTSEEEDGTEAAAQTIRLLVRTPRGVEVFLRDPFPVGPMGSKWYEYADLSEDEEASRPKVVYESLRT